MLASCLAAEVRYNDLVEALPRNDGSLRFILRFPKTGCANLIGRLEAILGPVNLNEPQD